MICKCSFHFYIFWGKCIETIGLGIACLIPGDFMNLRHKLWFHLQSLQMSCPVSCYQWKPYSHSWVTSLSYRWGRIPQARSFPHWELLKCSFYHRTCFRCCPSDSKSKQAAVPSHDLEIVQTRLIALRLPCQVHKCVHREGNKSNNSGLRHK